MNDYEKHIYKTVDGLNLPMNVYLPENINEDTKTILLIHGGGWKDAVKENKEWDGGWLAPQAKYYASKGYISIAISYRTIELDSDTRLHDLIDDCRDAVKYIRKNLNYVNFNQFIILGESAGGHLATMLGIDSDDEIRASIVIALNPVLDCTKERWSYAANTKEELYEVSPLYKNPQKCARFLFLHGDNDSVVDIKDTLKFNERLNAFGFKSKTITIENAQHAFFLFNYKYPDEFVMSILKIIDAELENIYEN